MYTDFVAHLRYPIWLELQGDGRGLFEGLGSQHREGSASERLLRGRVESRRSPNWHRNERKLRLRRLYRKISHDFSNDSAIRCAFDRSLKRGIRAS